MVASESGCRAVIFDFGNVLVAWDPYLLYAQLLEGEQAVKDFLEEVAFAQWNLQQDLGRSFAVGVRELCERFPHRSELIRAYDERWRETIAGPIEETVAVLERLKLRGFPLYGMSNWSAEKFDLIRKEYVFFSWFDRIFVSGELRLAKPDPRFYQLVLKELALPAGECLFIDDSAANVEAAGRIGFQTIQFRSGAQLEEELKERGML